MMINAAATFALIIVLDGYPYPAQTGLTLQQCQYELIEEWTFVKETSLKPRVQLICKEENYVNPAYLPNLLAPDLEESGNGKERPRVFR